ncbi:MAG: REP-associated tyrosine transposase [Acidobacteriota bacterium]
MPLGLVRYQESGQSHFVTFSCYRRIPHFRPLRFRDLFLESLERMRVIYRFRVYGYAVMPEHVHLLVSEPETGLLATALQALKISVSRQAKDPHLPTAGRCGAPSVNDYGADPFWQKRYYDHNVRSHQSFEERLHYIHCNPVKRGLVANPEDWRWSSFRHYAFAELGHVEIESEWTAARRNGRVIRPLGME